MRVRWAICSMLFVWAGLLSAQSADGPSGTPAGSGGLRSGEGQGDVPFVFDGTIIDAIEFFTPHKGGNGRSCATCHRPEDNFGLTPATVEARYQAWQARRRHDATADDPLFRSIDADDFGEDFTTLRTKALVRVVLPLPPNVKLAEAPLERSVTVWRSVPTVVNAGITGPFQADGRLATLHDQALSAMRAHSETTRAPREAVVRRLVRFQEHLFSSGRARSLARALAAGEPLPNTDPPLSAVERQGKATFQQFCASCHGGASQTVNTDARFLPVPSRGPLPGPQAFVNVFVQTPRPRPFFDEVPSANLPQRTYVVTGADGTQQELVTSDPGRGLITGDVREFGRFDVPTLFGIGRTAPYFHDNSASTLEDLVKHYQGLFNLLTFFEFQGLFAPPVDGQGCRPGECGFAPLPDDQVPALLAYLRKL
jgi:cytochrome c peroxidase